jgi:hypothetical protein
MSKLKLTKIEMTTKDGKAVELTLDEARDLHAQLDELFGKKVEYIPSQPIVIDRYRYRPYRYWSEPMWGTDGGTKVWMSAKSDSGLSLTCRGDSVTG